MGRSAYFRGPNGLSGAAQHRDAPRAPRGEQLVGVDLVGPAEEVLRRVVVRRAEAGTSVRIVSRRLGSLAADELLELHQQLASSSGGEEERLELLDLVGLADARTRRVEEMSKGMQQRLGIAQSLVGAPRLLLLDEPTSALDPVGRRTVRTLLEE